MHNCCMDTPTAVLSFSNTYKEDLKMKKALAGYAVTYVYM